MKESRDNIINLLDQMTLEYTQLCQRGDGSVYGIASGKQCKRGRPISFNPSSRAHQKALIGQKLKKPEALARLLVSKFKKLGRSKASLKEAKDHTSEEIKSNKVRGEGLLRAFGKNLGNRIRAQGFSSDKSGRMKAIDERANKLLDKRDTQRIKDKLTKAIGDGKLTPEKALDIYDRRISDLEKSIENIRNSRQGRQSRKQKLKEWEENLPQFKVPDSPRGYDIQKDIDNPGKDLGKGNMGQVTLTDGPLPGILKKGKIGQYEAEALARLQGTGVAPEFYGVQFTPPYKPLRSYGLHVLDQDGYISMSKMKGDTFYNVDINSKSESERQAIERSLIQARKVIHQNGVAHNDMHYGNAFLRPDGTVGIIDYGLAQVGYKFALIEAMASVSEFGNDPSFEKYYQYGTFSRNSPSFTRLVQNRRKAKEYLESVGLTWGEDYDFNIPKNIRSSEKMVAESPLADLSDDQIKKALDILYEGF